MDKDNHGCDASRYALRQYELDPSMQYAYRTAAPIINPDAVALFG